MGALSDDGRDDYIERDPVYTPQFVYEAFMDRYVTHGVRGGPLHLAPNEPLQECRLLVKRLNDMPDRKAAYELAKEHPWYVENEYNKCAVWVFER